MLRENKSLITKAFIFLMIIIIGVAFLLINRADSTENAPELTISNNEEYPNTAPQDATDITTSPSPVLPNYPYTRQPITLPPTPFVCRCPEPTRHLTTLTPPRPRHNPAQIATLQSVQSGNFLLETDGSLWTWGSNWSGQLGTGDLQPHPAPVQILDSVVYFSQSGFYAIRSDGSLWGWGAEQGQGQWTHNPVGPLMLMEDVSAVFQGGLRDFVIRTDGSLWTLGSDRRQDFSWSHTVPNVEVEAIRILDHVTDIFSTQFFSFILQCNGRLWTLRRDTLSHLVDEVTAFIPSLPGATFGMASNSLIIQTDGSLWSTRPTLTDTSAIFTHLLDDVAFVYRSNNSDFILQSNGDLWATGNNAFGQLGDGTHVHRSEPVFIMENVASIYRPDWDAMYTFAVTEDGELWGWGVNGAGQLGIGTFETQYYPIHILDEIKTVYITHSLIYALSTDDSLWVWGNMTMGNTPVRIASNVTTFYPIGDRVYTLDNLGSLQVWDNIWHMESFDGYAPFRPVIDSVTAFYPDHSSSFAILTDGSLWAWGHNWGNIGDGTFAHRPLPVNISHGFSYVRGAAPSDLGYIIVEAVPHQNPQVPFMVTGSQAYFYVDTQNHLWAWGENWSNHVGHDLPPVFEWGPVPPGFVMDGVEYVRSLGNSTYAIRSDNSLWAWGFGHDSTPTRFMESIAAIYSDGDNHFLLGTDGTLWRWARPDEPIPILEQVKALHWNEDTFFAHKTDGSLWSWGQNPAGLLGDGSPGTIAGGFRQFISDDDWENLDPTQILDNVAYFTLERNSAFAIQTNGTLWAWGNNSHGQLGDGTRINRYTPVRIMDGVTAIQADGFSTFATRADGGLWAWGWNAPGQLGDGTYVSRSFPTRVMDAPNRIYLMAGTVFAIYNDDSLWAWGSGFGSVPVYMMGDITEIFANTFNSHMFILQSDGSLWEMRDAQTEPQFVKADVAAVHLFFNENFIVTTDEEVWTWGNLWHLGLGEWDNWVDWDSMVRINIEI